MDKRLILHTSDWMLKDITSNIDKIKESGFNYIQISPIQECKAGNEWWKLYQPLSFNIGNKLGNIDDYKELCEKAHINGIKVIVDVVLRHVAGNENGEDKPYIGVDKKILPYLMDTEEGTDCDNNRDQMINCNWGMPSLNYYNTDLWKIYFDFLDKVLEYADGIRIDMMKHFALPEEGCNLLQELKYRYHDKYMYGEAINISSSLLHKYTYYVDVLVDKYHNYGGNSNNTVRFFESHDTYGSFGYTKNMTDDERLKEWGNLIARYNNCLFFARPYDNIVFSDNMKWLNSNTHYIGF